MLPQQDANAGPEPVENRAPISRLSIKGMSCNHCVMQVTQAVQGLPGVGSVLVSLDDGTAVVRWNNGSAGSEARLIEAVRQAGFEASSLQSASLEQQSGGGGTGGWRFNVLLGLVCTVPLAVGEWGFGLGHHRGFQWLAFLLAGIVQALAGARFYQGAWRQLKARRANMDTLVALGSTTAFLYSAWALVARHPGHAYFLEAAAIISLISLGHWLEARMSERASSSVRKLLELTPAHARLLSASGEESLVPASNLKPGDRISLRPGERVPADAVVMDGESSVDESMLTGESMPVDKAAGANVYAGTVNLNRRLVARVAASGEATTLAAIIGAVRRAQASRANIQRLGDQVSSVFVPVVLLVAVATALSWWLAPAWTAAASQSFASVLHWPLPIMGVTAPALIHAAAVLIVACPCAMGLATPAAIMAGANAAAEHGILVRDGVALEKAGRVSTVLFDKTGTLTMGQVKVAEFATYAGGDRPALHEIRLAAALARHSNHPLSQAVARLDPGDMPMFDWEELRGRGVQSYLHLPDQPARLAVARLGSLAWLESCGVRLSSGAEFAAQWGAQGATVLGIAVDHWLLGQIVLMDNLKPESVELVDDLKRFGYKVRLVTGDHQTTARAVGRRLGLAAECVHAEVMPDQKAEVVRNLQARGERVAFVGDGLNDAPALEQADLGIAVHRASDIALEAADILLLRSDIRAVSESLGLARATLRTIKQNLFWAFFYNALGIPLAAFGLFNPVLCAAAMGASDLLVITNALGLRYWKLITWRRLARSALRRFDREVLGAK